MDVEWDASTSEYSCFVQYKIRILIWKFWLKDQCTPRLSLQSVKYAVKEVESIQNLLAFWVFSTYEFNTYQYVNYCSESTCLVQQVFFSLKTFSKVDP